MIRIMGAALLLSVSGAALASDPVAFRAITQNDLVAAEAQLTAQLAEGSTEPGVLLNLAHVYRHTARVAQAESLYRQVLATQNVQMAKPDGNPIWSHDLAQRGLDRARQFATR